MNTPNKFTEMFPEYPVNEFGMPNINGMPLREWGKRVFTDYVEYHLGKEGWKTLGSSPPSNVVDSLFACIQVALLGSASGPEEAKAKRDEVDRLLIWK